MAIPHKCCFYKHVQPDGVPDTGFMSHDMFTFQKSVLNFFLQSLHIAKIVQAIPCEVDMTSGKNMVSSFPLNRDITAIHHPSLCPHVKHHDKNGFYQTV